MKFYVSSARRRFPIPYQVINTNIVAPLFVNWEETLIWACLQGIMGKIYTDDLIQPTAAMAVLGDFSFFAGETNAELAAYTPNGFAPNYRILVPQTKSWQEMLMQVYGKKANIISRYATKKEKDAFNKETLERIIKTLPQSYTLSMMEESLYHKCKAEPWSADLVAQFPDYTTYQTLGIGAVICKDNLLVSGASSYARYLDGIEIEIDTKEPYRKKGLATICGAKLILECLNRDLYPSWDAHTQASLALAEKLGYHYSHTYTAIEIWNS